MSKILKYKPRLKKNGHSVKINDYYSAGGAGKAGYYTKEAMFEKIREGFEIDFDYSNVKGKANYYGLTQFRPEMHFFSILETQKKKEQFTPEQVKRILYHGGLLEYIRRLEDAIAHLS